MKKINYLTQEQLTRLTEEFYKRYRKAKGIRAKQLGRHWIVFLLLRYTGARISEITSVNELTDLNLDNNSIAITTLRIGNKEKRLVYFDDIVKKEYLELVSKYPDLKGHVLNVNRINFYELFRKVASQANIPKELAHPNILRHTRAIELVNSGTSLKEVQQILGHRYIVNTAVYLKYVD